MAEKLESFHIAVVRCQINHENFSAPAKPQPAKTKKASSSEDSSEDSSSSEEEAPKKVATPATPTATQATKKAKESSSEDSSSEEEEPKKPSPVKKGRFIWYLFSKDFYKKNNLLLQQQLLKPKRLAALKTVQMTKRTKRPRNLFLNLKRR